MNLTTALTTVPSKHDRLESIIRGREKFQHQTHPGGLTNLEKQRKKNFLMVRKGDTVHRKTKMGEKQVR